MKLLWDNIPEQTNHYLLTIRAHNVKKYVDEDHIRMVIGYLKLSIPTLKVIVDAYEIDSTYQQLHWHAWVTTHSRIRYRKFSTKYHFRIFWRSLKNRNICKVYKYLYKQDTDWYRRTQLLDENYYRYNYGFT